MKIVGMLYCLGNNFKKIYLCSVYGQLFFMNILCLQMIDCRSGTCTCGGQTLKHCIWSTLIFYVIDHISDLCPKLIYSAISFCDSGHICFAWDSMFSFIFSSRDI